MFYFNGPDQIKGDEAYNKKDLATALDYYYHGLYILRSHARSQQADSIQFYDAYTHVLADIIFTTCYFLIQDEENSIDKLNETWRPIPELIHSMQKNWEIIRSDSTIFTSQKIITNVYLILANTCEKISDNIVDLLDEEIGGLSKTDISFRLANAVKWLKRAIDYTKASSHPIKMNVHRGYLYLLERQYKNNNSPAILRVMDDHLKKYDLLNQLLSPEIKLELLAFTLRVSIELTPGKVHTLIREGKDLIRECEPLAPEIVIDFKELINPINMLSKPLSRFNKSPLSANRRKANRSRIIEDDYQDDDTVQGSCESPSQNSQEISTKKRKTSNDEASLPIKRRKPNRSRIIEDDNCQDNDEVAQVAQIKKVVQFTQANPDAHNESPLQKSDNSESIVKKSPVIPIRASNSSLIAINKPFKKRVSFFVATSNPLPETKLPPLPNYSVAFQKAINSAIPTPANPMFLANLLSLTADYFRKLTDKTLTAQSSIMIAVNLYKQTLNIEPTHVQAKNNFANMCATHAEIIRPNATFGGTLLKPATSFFNTPLDKKAHFDRVLTEMFDELDAYLCTTPEKMGSMITAMLKHITLSLAKNNLVKNKTSDIVALINVTYEQELATSPSPSPSPSQNPINS